MAKVFIGKVIATKMQDTAVVEISRLLPHPLYRKLLKRSKNFKVALNNKKVEVGNTVKIQETKPISKDKHFKLVEVIKS